MSSNAKLPQHERPGRWTDTVVPEPCVEFVWKKSDEHWMETIRCRQWWTAADDGDKLHMTRGGRAQYREWQYGPFYGRF
jgi:hypothetical protein